MEVDPHGVPMTNGEVYALLRRRRDLRTAQCAPPFGLSVTPAATGPGQDPPPPYYAAELGGDTSAIFSPSPLSIHLIVLAMEVSWLRYLRHGSSLKHHYGDDGEAVGVDALYGPSSVVVTPGSMHDRGWSSPCGFPFSEEAQKLFTAISPCRTRTDSPEDEEAAEACGTVYLPGTVAYVSCVEKLLTMYEKYGKEQECQLAESVKGILTDMLLKQDPEGGDEVVPVERGRFSRGWEEASVPYNDMEDISGNSARLKATGDDSDIFGSNASGAGGLRETGTGQDMVVALVVGRPATPLAVRRILRSCGRGGWRSFSVKHVGAACEEKIARLFCKRTK